MVYLFLSLGAFTICVFLFFTFLYGGRSIAQGKSIQKKRSVVERSTMPPPTNMSERFRIHISHVPQETGNSKEPIFTMGGSDLHDTSSPSSDCDEVFSFPVQQSCLNHLTKSRITQSPTFRRRTPSATFLRDFRHHGDKFSIRPILSN